MRVSIHHAVGTYTSISLGGGGDASTAAAAVDAMADVYRAMLAEEQQAGPRDASDASLAWLNNVLTQKGTGYDEFILSL